MMMYRRQSVTRHIHQKMMFNMIIDPIRGDENPLEQVNPRGACVAQRVVFIRDKSVLCNIPQA